MKKINFAYIVDDDPLYVMLLQKLMGHVDFCDNLSIFKNGKEALDDLTDSHVNKKRLPEVILLDLNMPILDGWQFLEKFVNIPFDQKITVYVVSSSINELDIQRVEAFKEVRNYIFKPVKKETLQTIKQDYLSTVTV